MYSRRLEQPPPPPATAFPVVAGASKHSRGTYDPERDGPAVPAREQERENFDLETAEQLAERNNTIRDKFGGSMKKGQRKAAPASEEPEAADVTAPRVVKPIKAPVQTRDPALEAEPVVHTDDKPVWQPNVDLDKEYGGKQWQPDSWVLGKDLEEGDSIVERRKSEVELAVIRERERIAIEERAKSMPSKKPADVEAIVEVAEEEKPAAEPAPEPAKTGGDEESVDALTAAKLRYLDNVKSHESEIKKDTSNVRRRGSIPKLGGQANSHAQPASIGIL